MRKVKYGLFASEPYEEYDPYWPIGMKSATRIANARRDVAMRYYIEDETGTNIIVEDPTVIEKIIARAKHAFDGSAKNKIVGYRTNGTTSKAKRKEFLERNIAKVNEKKAIEKSQNSKTTEKKHKDTR